MPACSTQHVRHIAMHSGRLVDVSNSSDQFECLERQGETSLGIAGGQGGQRQVVECRSVQGVIHVNEHFDALFVMDEGGVWVLVAFDDAQHVVGLGSGVSITDPRGARETKFGNLGGHFTAMIIADAALTLSLPRGTGERSGKECRSWS